MVLVCNVEGYSCLLNKMPKIKSNNNNDSRPMLSILANISTDDNISDLIPRYSEKRKLFRRASIFPSELPDSVLTDSSSTDNLFEKLRQKRRSKQLFRRASGVTPDLRFSIKDSDSLATGNVFCTSTPFRGVRTNNEVFEGSPIPLPPSRSNSKAKSSSVRRSERLKHRSENLSSAEKSKNTSRRRRRNSFTSNASTSSSSLDQLQSSVRSRIPTIIDDNEATANTSEEKRNRKRRLDEVLGLLPPPNVTSQNSNKSKHDDLSQVSAREKEKSPHIGGTQQNDNSSGIDRYDNQNQSKGSNVTITNEKQKSVSCRGFIVTEISTGNVSGVERHCSTKDVAISEQVINNAQITKNHLHHKENTTEEFRSIVCMKCNTSVVMKDASTSTADLITYEKRPVQKRCKRCFNFKTVVDISTSTADLSEYPEDRNVQSKINGTSTANTVKNCNCSTGKAKRTSSEKSKKDSSANKTGGNEPENLNSDRENNLSMVAAVQRLLCDASRAHISVAQIAETSSSKKTPRRSSKKRTALEEISNMDEINAAEEFSCDDLDEPIPTEQLPNLSEVRKSLSSSKKHSQPKETCADTNGFAKTSSRNSSKKRISIDHNADLTEISPAATDCNPPEEAYTSNVPECPPLEVTQTNKKSKQRKTASRPMNEISSAERTHCNPPEESHDSNIAECPPLEVTQINKKSKQRKTAGTPMNEVSSAGRTHSNPPEEFHDSNIAECPPLEVSQSNKKSKQRKTAGTPMNEVSSTGRTHSNPPEEFHASNVVECPLTEITNKKSRKQGATNKTEKNKKRDEVEVSEICGLRRSGRTKKPSNRPVSIVFTTNTRFVNHCNKNNYYNPDNVDVQNVYKVLSPFFRKKQTANNKTQKKSTKQSKRKKQTSLSSGSAQSETSSTEEVQESVPSSSEGVECCVNLPKMKVVKENNDLAIGFSINNKAGVKSGYLEVKGGGEKVESSTRHNIVYTVWEGKAQVTINGEKFIVENGGEFAVGRGLPYSISNVNKSKKLLLHFIKMSK